MPGIVCVQLRGSCRRPGELGAMASAFLGELLGTMVLVLLGNGVVAGVLLNKSKAHNAGWIVITADNVDSFGF